MIIASHHDCKAPTRIQRRLIGMLLLVTTSLFALPGQAEEELDFLPGTDTFRFNTQDRFYETREYSGNFQIKRLDTSEKMYFQQFSIPEKRRHGLVIEKEGYSLGFNHHGLELLIKF